MDVKKFNIRVYGLLLDNSKVLLTHELRGGMQMTKFPGGGLEKGEGIEACLQREFMEELGIEVQLEKLFYVNEFLQISAFNPEDQLISIYYLVTSSMIDRIDERDELKKWEDDQIFEWVEIEKIEPEKFTFPIDKIVAGLLKN